MGRGCVDDCDHRGTRLGLLLPVSAPPIGFRDVAPDAYGFEIDERLIAVIALIADHLGEAVSVGPHHSDVLGRFDQGLNAGLGVAVIGILQGDSDDRPGLEIDSMLGFVRQKCVRPAFIFVIFASGSCGWVQSSFEPFFFRFRSIRARSTRVGVSMPEACGSFVRKFA